MEQSKNFAISGWAGVGATTVSSFVADYFSFRYLYLGNVFRLLGERLGYANEGKDRVLADDFLEAQFGVLIDRLSVDLLQKESGLLVESDIAMFVLGKHAHVKSVFLTCQFEQRVARAIGDQRVDAADVLVARDAHLAAVYEQMWKIQLFDENAIATAYDLVLDTSHLGIAETVLEVLSFLKGQQVAQEEIQPLLVLYATAGKAGMKEHLRARGLLVEPGWFLKHLKENFGEEIARLPVEARQLLSD